MAVPVLWTSTNSDFQEPFPEHITFPTSMPKGAMGFLFSYSEGL